MYKMSVIYKDKSYRYIFSLINVFLRFHWLRPLESKHSSRLKRELKKIYFVHGFPKRLQSDNGGEFTKHVREFCTTNKVKMVRCRPYHPEAQCNVERLHIYYVEKYIMIRQGRESTELIGQNNYPIMLDA